MASVNIIDFEIVCSQGDLRQSVEAIKNLKTHVSSKVLEIDGQKITIPYYLLKEKVRQNQNDIYTALEELISKLVAKIDLSKRSSTALLIGTSLIDWYLVDAINCCAYEHKKTPYVSQKRGIDSYSSKLALKFGLNEFTMSINTACTSSANALLEAKNLINAGIVEQVIVIGLEIFSPVMSSGFYSMELISKTAPKPFDINRDGLVLGEGIAGIVLGKQSTAWSLEGGFSNCNSQTITSVSQSGEECVEVMKKALQNCSLKAKDITALKAHATGSSSNDEAEINAISKVFEPKLVFTALKPYIGHTIGASGVLEIAILMGAIDSGFLPKTIFCQKSIMSEFQPINKHKKCKSGVFMCNYFGFGGNNTSLIIKKSTA
ncbi:MAG: 3-oxoacyl-ACP synthase [Epsilonproteobacteria bacterium]|nr:3-oxoacyl-ACP synthase [Campylobacterota bacterium]